MCRYIIYDTSYRPLDFRVQTTTVKDIQTTVKIFLPLASSVLAGGIRVLLCCYYQIYLTVQSDRGISLLRLEIIVCIMH